MNQENNKPAAAGPQAASQQNGAKAYPLDTYSNLNNDNNQGDEKSPYYKSAAPTINLPKGGGALKGIDEKFTVNAVNGTASLQVALPLTPGRGGFTPALSLQYNSGSGNSEFGLGWGLSLPAIQRKTDKKLPQYNDAAESDVFLLAGAEDLVPVSSNDVDYGSPAITYHVKRYRPRIEGLFARIEHITHDDTAGSWWRVTTRDNVVTYYGLTSDGRISDPQDEKRIFRWLPQLSYDHKGNMQLYEYMAEDMDNVPTKVHERNRLNYPETFTNRYLKRVKYCNRDPYMDAGIDVYMPELPTTDVFWMEAVLDYEHHTGTTVDTLTPSINDHWPCRKDPFSDFHAGFEIRTYRRCRRILMFHYFREMITGSPPVDPEARLVRSLDIVYHHDDTPDEYAEADFITSFIQNGYSEKDGDYIKRSLPAMTMDYQLLEWDTRIQNVSKEDAKNAPQGLTGAYQWIDLYGEGLPGILTEQANGWFYKTNLGDGHFTPALAVAPKPSLNGLGSNLQWQDLDADGRRQVVSRTGSLQGYYELDDDQEWQSFRPFKKNINIDWNSPYTKMLDLNGDGRADVLITEDRAWTWYANEGTDGFDIGGNAQTFFDEEKGPCLLLNDQVQSIFLADMNGDGMTDIVRIKNGEVCYWPNLGYGRFGMKVTMSNAPIFDRPDLFNPMYLTVADISGTGAADVIYLGGNKCTAWINLSGNALSDATVINPLPGTDQYSKIGIMDFLGNGTGCIVWSSPLPQHRYAPMRYIDLMGGNKPYLMTSYRNGMGKTVALTYKNSTKYYLEDKSAGAPWATRLPFPVHCVQQITTSDDVSDTSYTQTYTYHHGYYDHEEREFRGFGRVESTDTDVAHLDETNQLDQYPVLTKTWYHTGAWMLEGTLLEKFATEYYNSDNWKLDTVAAFPDGLSALELREAHRALKGQALRQEVYAQDGSGLEGKPYMVTANSYIIKLVQAQGSNRYASFFSHQQENLVWHTERIDSDPRILHDIVLEVNDFGDVIAAAKIAYPRSGSSGVTEVDDTEVQQENLATYTATKYTADIFDTDSDYHLCVPYQVDSYQLYSANFGTAIWVPDLVRDAAAAATTISFGTAPSTPVSPPDNSIHEKRQLSCVRTLYLDNDAVTPLSLGDFDSLALPYRQYTLAFSDGNLVSGHYFYNDDKITEDMLDEGGYLRSGHVTYMATDLFAGSPPDPDDWVWLPGGTQQYDDPTIQFYTPVGFFDPWGNLTQVSWWFNGTENYYLLPQSVTDAKDNVNTVLAYDWRCLQPSSMQDMNENISEILYDGLCMPVAMAVKGKGNEADELDGIDPEDTTDKSNQAAFWIDPKSYAADLLQNATWRCVYDLETQPTAVAMIARELHHQYCVDNSIDSPLMMRFTYTDGLGRLAMHKTQAADDPDTHDPRWIGNGKTLYNNKGKAVMQFEPYFSSTHAYDSNEAALAVGVSPKIHYDPLGRVERTDLPDGSYTKTVWDAWTQVTYDNNDTVLDSDWYTAHAAGSTEEQDAAAKAAEHDSTPTTVYLDTLARPFYTIQHNRYIVAAVWTDFYYHSYVDLDIMNDRLAVHDARGLTPLTYDYNLVKAVLKQISVDSGTQHMLTAADGQPLYAWDADNRQFHFTYDELRRTLTKEVDPGTGNKVLEVMLYGEDQVDDTDHNLRGKPYIIYDGAGSQTMPDYDFKGQPLTSVRQFTGIFTEHPDWSDIGLVGMESDTYTTAIAYDALGRPMSVTTPDAGITTYTYENSGMLYHVHVENAGNVGTFDTDIINAIEYDARGQRTKVQYENGATTTYEYDPNTFRVTRIRTTRSSDSAVLQDLKYWYDPVGNITLQKEYAQQTVYFDGAVVSPDNDYTYDALYRLIQAEGREHTGLSSPPGPDGGWSDEGRIGLSPLPSDYTAMRRYVQYYSYDEVGNMLEMKHTCTDSSQNWTREFTIGSGSNRLYEADVLYSPVVTETYTYDNRGNLIDGMSHLGNALLSPPENAMTYNELNRLEKVIVNGDITAYYQYDSRGERVRKVKVDDGAHYTHVRKYVGQWEMYSKIDTASPTSAILFERETLHVMDDTARVALVDTPTYDPAMSGEVQVLRYQFGSHLGTASLELDDSANVISYEEYYPFGSTSFQVGDTTGLVSQKRYRYTGKERDEETGFYYIGARYYMPWLARWCAVDPVNSEIYNAFNEQPSRNLQRESIDLTASSYEYCYNNPIRFTDPTGEQVPWRQIGEELGNIPQKSVERVKSFQNSVRKPIANAAEAVTQSLTRMAGKSAVFKINSEIQDMNVSRNGFQVPKLIGASTTQKRDSIKTDTDPSSANKFNLYVHTNTMFHVSESNANKFANYELGVVAALMNNFVTGLGPENYSFPENGIISNKFIENKTKVLKEALTDFLKDTSKPVSKQFEFGGAGLKQDFKQSGTLFSITGLVGSASINITNDARRGGVAISIFNITSLTSGALGKELGPESAWPQSYMRDGETRVPYGNISQTFSIFIPYGNTEVTKYINVQNVLNQMNTTK
ncbi:MAG: VCBS repeat-containing protein [Bacteroidetes bacterium]|nr:VCBS repeat-containing protein [Bacteroidota bacterium]